VFWLTATNYLLDSEPEFYDQVVTMLKMAPKKEQRTIAALMA
jgi:hypothetical protein